MRHDELSDFEALGAEIQQHSVLHPRRPEIAEDLGEMLIGKRIGSLHFDDQAVIDDQIGIIVANDCPIVVKYPKVLLLFHLETLPP